MKKILLFLAVTFSTASYSQTGDSAEDPIIIGEIPFFDSDDTSNYSSYYNGYVVEGCCTSNCGSGSYGSPNLQGPEVVYSYTPAEDTQVSVRLFGVQSDYPSSVYTSILVVNEDLIGVDPNGGSDTVCYINGNWTFTTTVSYTTNPIDMEAGNTYFIIVNGGDGSEQPFSFVVYETQEGPPSLSIDEENRLNVSIYPNPTSDIVYIEGNYSQLKAVVYDILGKQVMNEPITNSIDISQLEKGVYILQLSDGAKLTTQRIIKN